MRYGINRNTNTTIRPVIGALMCAVLLLGNAAVHGQTKRVAAAPAAPKKAGCNGAWTGVIKFTKKLRDEHHSDEPVFGKIDKEKNRLKIDRTRSYKYEGRAIVSDATPGAEVARTNVSFTDTEKEKGIQKEWASCHAFNDEHWFISESLDERLTTATAQGPARSFGLNVDQINGVYNFNLKFPAAPGKYQRQIQNRKSGFCQAKNNLPYDRTDKNDVPVDGEGFSITGQRIDPRNPDVLKGTHTWGDDGLGKIRTFSFEVSWEFTRCPQKLLITELKFEHPKFPDYDKWAEIEHPDYTVDGNLVKVKAKVLNLSPEAKYAEVFFKETFKGDQYNGSMPDRPLNDSTVSIRLEGGEEREVEILWDSSGYAWYDDGRPRDMQRIKAEAWENQKLQHDMTKNLKIAPRPLILVHGIWSNPNSWQPGWQNLMYRSHGSWKAFIFGEGDSRTGSRSVFDNGDALGEFVKRARTEVNAWHVDMVAHSTGGLVARLFVHKFAGDNPDGRPTVKHLMMLGTPNNGVPCAGSVMQSNDAFANMVRTVKELEPAEIARFNQFVNNRNGAKFSALVGNSFPILCAGFGWNDGFVAVDSAKHGVSDFAITSMSHPDLVKMDNFGKFVLPHVVTGPRGTYPLPVRSEEGGVDGRTSGND